MGGTQPGDDARATDVILSALPTVIAVYRFGSSVTGPTRPDSDIDIAILADSPAGSPRTIRPAGPLPASTVPPPPAPRP